MTNSMNKLSLGLPKWDSVEGLVQGAEACRSFCEAYGKCCCRGSSDLHLTSCKLLRWQTRMDNLVGSSLFLCLATGSWRKT